MAQATKTFLLFRSDYEYDVNYAVFEAGSAVEVAENLGLDLSEEDAGRHRINTDKTHLLSVLREKCGVDVDDDDCFSSPKSNFILEELPLIKVDRG